MASAAIETVDTSSYVLCDPIADQINIQGQNYFFWEGVKQLLDLTLHHLGPNMDGSHWRSLNELNKLVQKLDSKVILQEEFLTDTITLLQMLNDPNISDKHKRAAISIWFEPNCNIWDEKPSAKVAIIALTTFAAGGEQLFHASCEQLVVTAVARWIDANTSKSLKHPLSQTQKAYLISQISYSVGFSNTKPVGLPFFQGIKNQSEVVEHCKAWTKTWLQPYFILHQLIHTVSFQQMTLADALNNLMFEPPKYEAELAAKPQPNERPQPQLLHLVQSVSQKSNVGLPEVVFTLPSSSAEQKQADALITQMACYFCDSVNEGIRAIKANDIAKVNLSAKPCIAFTLAAQIIDNAHSLEELVSLFEQHPYIVNIPQSMTSALTYKLIERLDQLSKAQRLTISSPYAWQQDFNKLNALSFDLIINQLTQEHYHQVMNQAQDLDTLCRSAMACMYSVQCCPSVQNSRLQTFQHQFSALYKRNPAFPTSLVEASAKYATSTALITQLHDGYQTCLRLQANSTSTAAKLVKLVESIVLTLSQLTELQTHCGQLILARQKTLIDLWKISLEDMQQWQQWCAIPCLKETLQGNFTHILAREIEDISNLEHLTRVTHFTGTFLDLLDAEQQQQVINKITNKTRSLIERGTLTANNGAQWVASLPLEEARLFHHGFNSPELDKLRLLKLQTLKALPENDPSLADVQTLNLMPDSFFQQCNNTIKANVLLKAVSDSQLALTQRLIRLKANLDVQDKEQNNLLMIAAANGCENIVNHLLSLNHYLISTTNSQWQNALHKALSSQNPQVVTLILSVVDSTTLEQKSATGFRPLHRAILVDNPECLRLLLGKKPNLDIQLVGTNDQEQQGPMHLACRWKKPATLSVLLETQPELCTQKSSLGYVPIATAVRHGDIKIVTQLLQAKCDTGTRTAKGENLIHLAARNTECEAVFETIWDLLELKAQRKQEINELNALEVAIQTHHHQAFDTCLNSGLFKLAQCRKGLNLLQFTAKYGDAHTMSGIIDLVCLGQSVNDNAKGEFQHKTALDLANSETQQVLVNKGAKTYQAIQEEIRRKQEEEERHRRYVEGLECDNRRLKAKVSNLKNQLSEAENRISYAKLNMTMNGNLLGAATT